MKFPSFILHDSLGDIRLSKCFLNNYHNDLQSMKNCLFQQFYMISVFTAKFICSEFTKIEENQYLLTVIKKYLYINQQFLQLLTVLIYMIVNLSSYKDKLMSIKWYNWESLHNIYIYYKQMIVIISYHKTQWQMEIRLIIQFLFTIINDFLMHYLIYVLSFLCFLHNQMKLKSVQKYLFIKKDS